jgi:L-idonate 5-dehydrogenase
MRFPQERFAICCDATRCPGAATMSAAQAAFAEPFAVCPHAGPRGPLLGARTVPVGAHRALTVIVAPRGAPDRRDGYSDARRRRPQVGADGAINVARRTRSPYEADKGYFDVLFEARATEGARGAFAMRHAAS